MGYRHHHADKMKQEQPIESISSLGERNNSARSGIILLDIV
jgi:hypothetical protein